LVDGCGKVYVRGNRKTMKDSEENSRVHASPEIVLQERKDGSTD